MKTAAPASTAEHPPTVPEHLIFDLKNRDTLQTLEGKQLAPLWILALHDPHQCSPALAHAIGGHLEIESLPLQCAETLTIMPHAVTFVDDQHNEWQLCRLDPAATDLHFLCNDFLIQVFHFDRIIDYTPRSEEPAPKSRAQALSA